MLLELLNITLIKEATIMDKISWALGQFWSLFSSLLALISDNDFQTSSITALKSSQHLFHNYSILSAKQHSEMQCKVRVHHKNILGF